jgi:hypothetical protein
MKGGCQVPVGTEVGAGIPGVGAVNVASISPGDSTTPSSPMLSSLSLPPIARAPSPPYSELLRVQHQRSLVWCNSQIEKERIESETFSNKMQRFLARFPETMLTDEEHPVLHIYHKPPRHRKSSPGYSKQGSSTSFKDSELFSVTRPTEVDLPFIPITHSRGYASSSGSPSPRNEIEASTNERGLLSEKGKIVLKSRRSCDLVQALQDGSPYQQQQQESNQSSQNPFDSDSPTSALSSLSLCHSSRLLSPFRSPHKETAAEDVVKGRLLPDISVTNKYAAPVSPLIKLGSRRSERLRAGY